jgi:hypothetical protein
VRRAVRARLDLLRHGAESDTARSHQVAASSRGPSTGGAPAPSRRGGLVSAGARI